MCIKQHGSKTVRQTTEEKKIRCMWFVNSLSDINRNISRKALLMLILLFQLQLGPNLMGA